MKELLLFLGDLKMFVKDHENILLLATSGLTAAFGIFSPEATSTIALGFFMQTLITEA